MVGKACAGCNNEIKDGNIVSCSGCNKIYHCDTHCAQISDIEVQSLESPNPVLLYLCNKCRNNGGPNAKFILRVSQKILRISKLICLQSLK